MFVDNSCNLCDSSQPQTQQHLLACDAIRDKCVAVRNLDVVYSDLFSNMFLFPYRLTLCDLKISFSKII